MANIGILCPGAIGHLNPMCNLGIELKKRGHKVTLFGVPEVDQKISDSSLKFYEIGAEDFPVGSLEALYTKLGQLDGIEGLKFTIQFFQKEADMLFREAPQAILSNDIELLVVDQVTAAGGTIADHLKLPFITVCNALPINREPGVPPYFTNWTYQNNVWSKVRNQLGNSLIDYLTKPIWDIIVRQRKQWDLPKHPNRSSSYSQLAQICQLPEKFDFPREQIEPFFHYVGPLKNPADLEPVTFKEHEFNFSALTGEPLIYASLGTLQNRNWDIFHCIAEACLEIPAQLVISLGNPRADLSKVNFPGSPIVVPYAPHQQLINRAQLVITHAGMNTTLGALSSGVPLIAIPITNEQPGIAARMARTGAGEVVTLKQLNPQVLKAAIETVLSTPTYRDNANDLSSAIVNSGGVAQAANVIEDVLSTRSPALRKP